jgi:hypothetical protein
MVRAELRPIAWLFVVAILFAILRIATMRLKHGVSLENVSWRMFWVAIVMDNIFRRYDAETVITSAGDGTHSRMSKHYAENNPSGMIEALDFRLFNLHPSDVAPIAAEARAALGRNYDVVIESDHYHIEYDPK